MLSFIISYILMKSLPHIPSHLSIKFQELEKMPLKKPISFVMHEKLILFMSEKISLLKTSSCSLLQKIYQKV